MSDCLAFGKILIFNRDNILTHTNEVNNGIKLQIISRYITLQPLRHYSREIILFIQVGKLLFSRVTVNQNIFSAIISKDILCPL